MPAGRGPEAFFDRALKNGSGENREGVDPEKVSGRVDPNTEVGYRKAFGLFKEFCAHRGKDNPVAWAYNMETLKDFVNELAWGIEGIEDEEDPDDDDDEEEEEGASECSDNAANSSEEPDSSANRGEEHGETLPRVVLSMCGRSLLLISIIVIAVSHAM